MRVPLPLLPPLIAVFAGCQATTRAGAPQGASGVSTCSATPSPPASAAVTAGDVCADCLSRLRAATAAHCLEVDASRVTLFHQTADPATCGLRGPDVTLGNEDVKATPYGAVSCPCTCANVYSAS